MEFENLINKAKKALQYAKNNQKYEFFLDRYIKMDQYLDKLLIAYKCGTLNNQNICLSIVRTLNQDDPQELIDSISEINHYYQENIYKRL